MSPILKVLSVVVLLGGLIFVHELGHFLVAKLFRVKVLKFSLGFGPRLLSFTRGETEYRLSALPLGGYVKMAGEDPEAEVAPEDRGRGFMDQPPWKRFLIALAGPGMNLVFPVALYFAAFVGHHQEAAPVVGYADPARAAARQGLQAGDLVLAVDGEALRDFSALQQVVQASPGKALRFEVQRGGERVSLTVTPDADTDQNPIESRVVGRLGVTPAGVAPMVAVPDAHSPAAQAGVRSFDKIVRVAGTPVNTWTEMAAALHKAEGAPVEITLLREETVDLPGAPLQKPESLTLTLRGAQGLEPAATYVWGVAAGTPAAEAGIERGERLVSVDGQPVTGMMSLYRAGAAARDQRPLSLELERAGQTRMLEVKQRAETFTDEMRTRSTRYVLGVQLVGTPIDVGQAVPAAVAAPPMVDVRIGPVEATGRAASMLVDVIRVMALGIGALFRGAVPLDSVGGPIMLFDIAARSAERGWMVFLHNMALISVNLGLLNLVPIPVLDGGHLLACVVETVRRRPLSTKAREVANLVGLFLLLSLMVLAFKNDIVRYFIP